MTVERFCIYRYGNMDSCAVTATKQMCNYSTQTFLRIQQAHTYEP